MDVKITEKYEKAFKPWPQRLVQLTRTRTRTTTQLVELKRRNLWKLADRFEGRFLLLPDFRRRLVLDPGDVAQDVAENDVQLFGAEVLRRELDVDGGTTEINPLERWLIVIQLNNNMADIKTTSLVRAS